VARKFNSEQSEEPYLCIFNKMFKNIIRALRLPFALASVLPFIFGSLIYKFQFNFYGFFLGLVAVIATHLSANLMNDYADSRSGVDWQDKKFYKFFGGSKLIQENVFTERFYLVLALLFAVIAAVCVVLLALSLHSYFVVWVYIAVIILGWMYSAKPLQLSYRRMGELVIFLLFGPITVMGGYFIQTGVFLSLKSFLLSLPFGFLTTAILFVNEIPDYTEDKKSGKFTLVSFTGEKKAFIVYYILVLLAFVSITVFAKLGYLNKFTYLSFLFIISAFKILDILIKHSDEKARLVEASKLTILLQASVSLVLIISLLL